MVHRVEFAKRVLALSVALVGAVEHPATGRSRAKVVKGLLAGGDDVRIERHAHVIVGAEEDRALAVANRHGGALNPLHYQVEWVRKTGGKQRFALLDQRVELGEKVGHRFASSPTASISWPTVSISACWFMVMRMS